MTLFWFIFGIALIFFIARFNESNALFWKLFLSFVLGIAVASLFIKCNNDERNEDHLTQVVPMQLLATASDPTVCLLADVEWLMPVSESSNAVSKANKPVLDYHFVSSEVLGNARDQPLNLKPPERMLSEIFHNTS